MPRLSSANLATAAATPFDYDRGALTPGIVHLGIGAFHRAHQAVYVDQLLKADPSWGIIGASLRRPDTKAALDPQDGLYTVLVHGADGAKAQIIGSIIGLIDAATDPEALLTAMTDPRVKIVSLTVTEKGYCHDPATGHLDASHPDVVRDLANPDRPASAPGFIVAALARRRAAGVPPFAVMSCDNLPSNGHTARTVVTEFATLCDKALGAFVAAEVAFPGTMVDRIVPATTDADRARVAEITGLEDAWPVVTEPFTQWVIEDNFPQGRPAFQTVGVQMVADVIPFERMKLRMLNGAHSSLAYLGYLAGHEFVSQVMEQPDFRRLVHNLMTNEVIPTLDMPGVDLPAYRDQLIARFDNPALKHRTWQIAMDGSQKLPQRLLGTIADRLKAGQGITCLSLGVAAWMRYASGVDENGADIDVRDPLKARFTQIATAAAGNPERLVDGFLALGEVFGTQLPAAEGFPAALVGHVESLLRDGAAATVSRLE